MVWKMAINVDSDVNMQYVNVKLEDLHVTMGDCNVHVLFNKGIS